MKPCLPLIAIHGGLACRMLLVPLLLLLLAVPATNAAERVLIGVSLPLTGPLASHGQDMLRGLKLGLETLLNAQAGTGGRSIEIQALDDEGQTARMLSNTQALAEAGALAVTGFGPGVEAVLPVLSQYGLPLVGAASGAQALREPPHPWVFNLRAGVQDEASAMVMHMDMVGLTNVAVISQADALGLAGRQGLRTELARYAVRPVAQIELALNVDEAIVRQGVEQACAANPQALVLMLEPGQTLQALRASRQLVCARLVYMFNEVGTRLLAQALAVAEIKGVVVPQVLPSPADLGSPLVAAFQRQAQAIQLKPSYAALEGYLQGRVLLEALGRCPRETNRRCLAAALEAKPLDISGYRLRFSPTDRHGSHFVDMTIVTADGRLRR